MFKWGKTKSDIEEIKRDLYLLRSSLDSVQSNNVFLGSSLKTVKTDITSLIDKNKKLEGEVRNLQRQIVDLKEELTLYKEKEGCSPF